MLPRALRLANRWRMPHERCGSHVRLSARVIPFPALIAHSASMAGFNVSPSATAAVCFPRSEAQLSESDCYGIAAILFAAPRIWGAPCRG
ncbi:hypothetical protein ABIC49_005974 [Burkholderia ambifaria]|jgi:hypothetical protein